MGDPDEGIAERMADELRRAPIMEVGFLPATVFQLVALVQLALRHPDLSPAVREVGEKFVAAAWVHYADCPTVREVITRGNDPSQDRPRRVRES
jgi:hypothetical protein